MKIAIVNEDTHGGPDDVNGRFGGAQLAPEYLARAMRDAGHDVTRYSGYDEHEHVDGIRYQRQASYDGESFDAAIALRNARWLLHLDARAKKHVVWKHDQYSTNEDVVEFMLNAQKQAVWVRDEHGHHSALRARDLIVVANSEYLKRRVERVAPVHAVIPPGVPELLFRRRIRPGKRLYTCGMWVECRGTLRAIEAFKIAKQKVPDLELYLFGDEVLWQRRRDSYGQRVFETAAKTQGVVACGTLIHSRMLRELNDCSILIHPATSETFGLAVAEAMAAGIPVVTRAAGALPEHHLPAYFNRPADMAEEIVRLCGDAERYESVAVMNRNRAQAYRWSRVAELWEGVLS